MINIEVPVLQIDTMMRSGTIEELTMQYAMNGKIDLSESLLELDVLVGAHSSELKINKVETYYHTNLPEKKSILNYVQYLFYETGVQSEEIHSTVSLARYLSGGNGYIKCKNIIKELSQHEKKVLVSALEEFTIKQADEFKELNIGIIEKNDIWKKVPLNRIIDNYRLFHKNLIIQDQFITVVPQYFWIQKIIQKEVI